ncbi:MAG: glucose-1-phosphate cytidylyltransferase [Acidimicrobiales bacterium]
MKAVILAGGRGSRLSEETQLKPKPMVEIGGQPLIWHLMQHYARHGVREFIVCLGYRGYVIKEYFANYYLHRSDVTFDLGRNEMTVHHSMSDDWRVTLIDTGPDTMTGGRLRRILPYVEDDAEFCFTYGDGLADLDISRLVAFHRESGRLATLTAVRPPGRFGSLDIDGDAVRQFAEKLPGDGGWINGGFFVLSPAVARYLSGDDCVWEREPLEQLAADGQLSAFVHEGFWHAMDTLRDREQLEQLWAAGAAPWRR